jgi:hypothetical protein
MLRYTTLALAAGLSFAYSADALAVIYCARVLPGVGSLKVRRYPNFSFTPNQLCGRYLQTGDIVVVAPPCEPNTRNIRASYATFGLSTRSATLLSA